MLSGRINSIECSCSHSDKNRPSNASEADSQLGFSDSPASSEDMKSVREVLEGFCECQSF